MMKCKIVQDLLPLYCDKLTSDESNEEIEKHLLECEGCNEIYENMCEKEEIDIDIKKPEKDIKPLKKIKRSTVIKIITSVIISAVVLFVIFIFVFYGVFPINSDKLDIQLKIIDTYPNNIYQIEKDNDDNDDVKETKKKEKLIIAITGDGCDTMRIKTESEYDYLEDGGINVHENIILYPILDIPFSNHTNTFIWSENVDNINQNDTITIHCKDRDIKYNVSDLLKEARDQNN
ncbi:MAG: zf-HC2 domain-containing protein [Oscillospiraceae bacterium]|nr:zf-HC2 domain-containing protein [Oscillospiraceae bacterium]